MDARSSPSAVRRSKDVPFYQLPEDKAHIAPSRIVSEAKNAIQTNSKGLRPLNTRRPETPREEQRKLFGEQSIRDPTNRPPSAFSLGSRHFDSESRPVSGTRLTPLDHKPKLSDIEQALAPKPPTDPNRPVRRPNSRTKLLQQSISVENSLESHQDSSTPERVHSGGSKVDRKSSAETKAEGDSSSKPRSKRRSAEGERSAEGIRAESGYASDSRDRDGSAGSSRGGEVSRGGSGNSQTRGGSAGKPGSGGGERKGSAGVERGGSAGKSGSAGKREEETPDEAYLYNTTVGPIVDEMAKQINSTKDKDSEKLIELSDALYSMMENSDMLGKNCKRRSGILKTVFKLLDLDNPRLLLKLARLILALKVSGNNLTNVCKLVFRVSRDDKNDSLFTEGNIIDLLIDTAKTADHVSSADALVYCVSSLKFLSGTQTVIKHLVKRNCVEALARLLCAVNKTNLDTGKANEQFGHILVQLTAALRNMSDISATRNQFSAHNIIEELCRVMDFYSHDGDLMLNVVRIFSKITMHADMCHAVSSHTSHFKSLLDILSRYKKREDIVVRVSFVLGNLTAKSDTARVKLFEQSKSMETLLIIFKHYVDIDLKSKSSPSHRAAAESTSDSEKKLSKTEDVLIKTIRVIANLSINEVIGPQIASNDVALKLLLQVLDHKSLEQSEELVLNTLATINNLSYYSITTSAITKHQLNVTESLMKFLQKEHTEGLAEATRVFGNLTREKPVRDFLVKQKVDEVLVAMLNSNHREVVFTACGVLINLMADDDKRPMLKKQGGIQKLIDALRDFAKDDWLLGSLVCQTLWNYSSKITSSNATFGEEASQELSDLLLEYLDEEEAMTVSDSEHDESETEMRDFKLSVWREDFYPVASQLLQRIENNQSKFVPLEHPT